MIRQLTQYLHDAVRRPRVELTRRQRQVRYAWELVLHCWRVLKRHRAEGMAAELTYRTIFSLIPLVVLGLVTFRVFGGLNEIESRVEDQIYSFFGVPDVPDVAYADDYLDRDNLDKTSVDGNNGDRATVDRDTDEEIGAVVDQIVDGNGTNAASQQTDTEPIDGQAAGESSANEADITEDLKVDSAADRQQVQASIRWALRELTEKVGTVDFASIGVIGLLLFIYAAIALSDAVESVFNLIYEAPTERPIHIRIAIHWSIITLGSGLLALSLYTSSRLVDYVGTATGLSVSSYVNHVLALVSSWVLLFLLYSLMPNTRVSVRAAAIGSLVASVLWECAKFGFQVYVSKAVPYSALYGSLGLIPLFLFWVYVTWFIFLFGLVWTYTLQTAPGRVPSKEEDEHTEDLLLADPDWMILLMVEIGRSFERGETVRRDDLGAKIGLPNRVIHPMLDALAERELVRKIEEEQGSRYLLARPADRITVDEVIAAGRHESNSKNQAWSVLKDFRQQNDARCSGIKLSQLLGANVV